MTGPIKKLKQTPMSRQARSHKQGLHACGSACSAPCVHDHSDRPDGDVCVQYPFGPSADAPYGDATVAASGAVRAGSLGTDGGPRWASDFTVSGVTRLRWPDPPGRSGNFGGQQRSRRYSNRWL